MSADLARPALGFRFALRNSTPTSYASAWEALGAPQWPTAAQNAKILAASEMRPEAVAAGADGDFDVGVLPPQGVVGVVIPRA